jgi:hypothetical protein
VAARLRPENAETVLGIVEGDALDKAGEHILGRCARIACSLFARHSADAAQVVCPPIWGRIG